MEKVEPCAVREMQRGVAAAEPCGGPQRTKTGVSCGPVTLSAWLHRRIESRVWTGKGVHTRYTMVIAALFTEVKRWKQITVQQQMTWQTKCGLYAQ